MLRAFDTTSNKGLFFWADSRGNVLGFHGLFGNGYFGGDKKTFKPRSAAKGLCWVISLPSLVSETDTEQGRNVDETTIDAASSLVAIDLAHRSLKPL